MIQKTLALTVRSLRVDSRSLGLHILRFALCALLLLNLLSAQAASYYQGLSGLTVFRWLVYTNVWAISILVPLLLAPSLTEEKEQNTLALLRMADIGPWAILLGKLIPSLLTLGLILIVQLPFALLTMALGGVQDAQIFAVFLSLGAYLLAVSCLSLLCSVPFRSSGYAVGLTSFMLLSYHLSPLILYLLSAFSQYSLGWNRIASASAKLAEWLSASNLVLRLQAVLATDFSGPLTSVQVSSNLVAAALFLVGAWAIFERFNKYDEPAVRHVYSGRSTNTERERVWGMAVTWKEYFYVGGGPRLLLVKTILYGGIILLAGYLQANQSFRFDREFLGRFSAGLAAFLLIPLEMSLLMAKTLSLEIRDKTLSALILLPTSTRTLGANKLLGILLTLLPAFGYLAGGLFLCPQIISDLFVAETGREFWLKFNFFLIVLGMLVLYWHLVLALSLRMSAWWALGVAALVQYFSMTTMISIVVFSTSAFVPDAIPRFERLWNLLALVIPWSAVCLLHWRLPRWIENRAAEI